MRRPTLLLGLLMAAAVATAQVPPPEPPVPPAAPVAPVASTGPAAPMAAAAPAVPAPPALPADKRERVEAVCMAEARTKAKAAGASEVIMKDVQDTDVKSDGYASMRAKVEIVSVDSKGKTKKKKGTFGCATRNDVITNFTFN